MKRPLAVRLLARFSGIASLLLLADASTTSLRAQSTIYSSNPATGTFKNVGVGFRFRVSAISGSNVTFEILPKSGTFGANGRALIRRGSTTGVLVGTGSNYSGGASTAGTIVVDMAATGFTSGSADFYTVKDGDPNVWDGPITITASALTVSLTNITSSPSSGPPGTSMTWTYTIQSNQSVPVLLGASLYSGSGNPVDLTTGTSRTLVNGTTTYQATFAVPAGTAAGTYSLRGGVWRDLNENGRIDGEPTDQLIAGPSNFNSFTVTSPTSVSLSNITSSPSSGPPGTSMTWTYTIQSNQSVPVLLGASLYSGSGNPVDLTTGTSRTLVNGTTTYQATFAVPVGTAAGTYSLRGGVWRDLNENGRIDGEPTDQLIAGPSNFNSFVVNAAVPNPLGIDTALLDGKKLGGIVQIGGFASAAPGGNGWKYFYIRRASDNAPLAMAAGDFPTNTVDVGRLIWRHESNGEIIATWADLLVGLGAASITLKVVGETPSSGSVESAPFTISLQNSLSVNLTIASGTGSFPRYKSPGTPALTTFNVAPTGNTGAVNIGWWGAAGFIPSGGGTSQSTSINRLGLNVVRAVATDAAGNRTVEAVIAPVAFRHGWGDPELEDGGSASVQGVDVVSGNLHLAFSDLSVPAIGVPFTVERAYNTRPDSLPAWTFNLAETISHKHDIVGDTGDGEWPLVLHERADGSRVTYFPNLEGAWIPATPGVHDQLKEDFKAGTFTIYTADTPPLVKLFKVIDPNKRANAEYRLESIKTLRGHGLTLTYVPGTERQIQKVTDQSGRDYVFTYLGDKIRRVTDFSNRYVEYTWSGNHIVSFRDVRGHTTTYEPHTTGNGAGRLNFIQRPVGNRPISGIIYDSQERVVQITSPTGTNGDGSPVNSTTNFAYQPAYTDVVYPAVAGNNLRFNLDGNRNVVGIIESYGAGAGNRTTSLQRLNTGTLGGNALGRANELGLTSSVTEPGSAAVSYTYASNGRGLVTQTAGAGGPMRINYPPAVVNAAPGKLPGNLALPDSVTDPTQNTFQFQFESGTGEFKGLLNPLGEGGKVLAFDAATGLPSRIDDGRGNETELFYTDKGDLDRIRVPMDPDNANRYIVYTYPPGDSNRGLPDSVTDRKGYRTEYEWDEAGNPTLVRVVGLGEMTMDYDANGNRISVKDRRNQTTFFDFDAMDRPWRVRQPSPDGVQPQPTSTTSFDVLGRPEQSRNANGRVSRSVYGTTGSGAGLLVRQETQTLGGAWEDVEIRSYDSEGRLLSTTDGEGVARSFVYHDGAKKHLVRRITESAPGGVENFKEFDYDTAERLIRDTTGTTDPSFTRPLPTTLYQYDPAGRVKTVINVMNGNWANPDDPDHLRTRVSYYGDDQIDEITDPRQKTIKHHYNSHGLLSSRRDADDNEWTYRYDANGNLRYEGFPGNGTYPARTIARTFDVLDRLESINYGDGVTPTISFGYDPNGNRLSMNDRWGSVSYTYDNLNRPTRITRSLSGLGSQTLDYSYLPGGQVQTITYPGARTVSYAYDHRDRMITVSPWTGGSFSYTWRRNDQLERITNPNGTQTSYEYLPSNGRLNRLRTTRGGTTIADQQFTYDPVGNIVRLHGDVPMTPPADANINMEHNHNNTLSTLSGQGVVNDPAGRTRSLPGPLNATVTWEGMDWLASYTTGGQTTSYTYDGDGVRLSRAQIGGTTRYLIDPTAALPNVVAENDGSNTARRFYIYGASGLLATIDTSDAVSTYHFSHRGDTLALTNAAGNVVDSYGYSPYGVTAASNATWNPFRFIGQHGVMDEGNGLHFMRARYYSASITRFLSMDQLPGSAKEAQTLNRFAYVSGNPFGLIDASGLSSSPIKDMKILYTEYGSDIIDIATDPSPLNVSVKLATRKEVSRGMAHFYAGADLLAQSLANPIRRKIGKAPLTRTYKEFVEENYVRNVKISKTVENTYDYAMVINSVNSIVSDHSKLRKTRRILEKRKLRNSIIENQFSINKALLDKLVK